MAAILAGSTPKYLLRVLDSEGNQLDPSQDISPIEVEEVLVVIYNAITGTIIARFYLVTDPDPAAIPAWTQMDVKDVEGDGSDMRVQLILTSAQTMAAEGNTNMIQVDVHIPDVECPDNVYILKQKGKFHEIVASKT
jgi:hypothetical protein